jgi:hypothetical protein
MPSLSRPVSGVWGVVVVPTTTTRRDETTAERKGREAVAGRDLDNIWKLPLTPSARMHAYA